MTPARLNTAAVVVILVLIALGVTGWIMSDRLIPDSPHQAYARTLPDDDAQANAWRAAAGSARRGGFPVPVPDYRESGRFTAGGVRAVGLEIPVRAGQRLVVQVAAGANLFAELYRLDNGEPEHVETLPVDGRPLRPAPGTADRTFVVLLQPRLGTTVNYRFAASVGGTLRFPVADGHDASDIMSFYGDPRDGGRRKHRGVDIFAPRHTPVRAVADGRVRTGESPRGGRTVWLRSGWNGPRYYYAHLESIGVDDGAAVHAGRELGTVGNSGNARGTPPHLHFGIYGFAGGPVDPWPRLQPPPRAIPDLQPGAFPGPSAGTVSASRLNLRQGPSTRSPVLGSYAAGTPVRVLAASGDWLRVAMDDRHGFMARRWLAVARAAPGA